MIQELLGSSASLLGGEGKISITGAVLQGSSTSNISPSSSPSSSSATAATTAASASATANTSSTGTASAEQQNLRCPRCDSSNTKFCYYNNYNLTQPRHFCKTCRRYWTKGGALRNVPIGGGCRKNKSTSSSVSAGKSSAATAGKVKSGSTDIIKSSLGFDHDPSSNPILWASPHNSQLLALLRATQNPNPNPHSVTVKEEEAIIGSPHMNSSSEALTSGLNARAIGVDPLGQVPIGLCSSSWRNNHQQHQHNHYHHQYQQQPHGLLLGGEVQNTGIHELYHRLRSSSSTYQTDHSGPAFLSNFASTSSTSPPILEPSAVAGGSGDLGCWNPAFSWSNLSSTNGAFP